MFNFEREFSANGTEVAAERQMSEYSLEQRQRDVYETHRHRTFSVAFYMTGSEIEAEEVLEGTFVRAFRSSVEPNGHGVDAAMVDELRERVPLDETVTPVSANPADTLCGRNVKRTELEEALQELPANERFVFLMRDVEGYDAGRVSELLGAPRQQVERTLLSARIRLRRILAQGAQRAEAA